MVYSGYHAVIVAVSVYSQLKLPLGVTVIYFLYDQVSFYAVTFAQITDTYTLDKITTTTTKLPEGIGGKAKEDFGDSQ